METGQVGWQLLFRLVGVEVGRGEALQLATSSLSAPPPSLLKAAPSLVSICGQLGKAVFEGLTPKGCTAA